MLCLGIESTAHTFGCSILESSLSNRNKGKILSPETKAKISAAKGGDTIFVYDSKGSLYNTFISA